MNAPADPAIATGSARLRVELAPPVASIIIGDGTRRNALATADWLLLADVARRLGRRRDLKVVLVRGVDATFTAGSDITEWRDADPAHVDASFGAIEQALAAVEEIDVVTVAVVQGVAAGAGCQLALACDLRVADDSARIGMPILRWGILPSPSFMSRLAASTGAAPARELVFRGMLLGAGAAERAGLLSVVVDADRLDASLAELVADLSAQPRSGLVATKRASRLSSASSVPVNADKRWSYSDPAEFHARVPGFAGKSGQTCQKRPKV
jgi:enoyl-CoA hydratase/carnithine racemase